MAKTVYDIIKKQNGEGFARVLRSKSLLDIPNITNIVKYAGHNAADAELLFPYLWSLKEFKEEKIDNPGDPFELLDTAGYHAFEVHNLDEQNSIKHFFRRGEELCTFRDPVRYKKNYIIHAVKYDVWRDPYAIKPSPNPERQDEYGTSVISIQIAKSGGYISIKNRYNHAVAHPDQTFHSNPDEIIPGLSASLKAYFNNVDWSQTKVSVPDGFVLQNEQIIKTNFEVNNHYFGNGFYTDNGNIVDIDKTKQVQIDYYIWDTQAKQLLNPSDADDDFVRVFNELTRGKKVDITGAFPNQTIVVDGVPIIELKNNQIITLNLPGVEHIDDNFLYHNKSLTTLNAPNLKTVGECFLILNHELKTLDVPNLKNADANFMYSNYALTTLNAPNLETVGNSFLQGNIILQILNVPNLQHVGDRFLYNNTALTTLNAPNLQRIGMGVLYNNKTLTTLNAPNLQRVDKHFLFHNTALTTLNAPNLENIGDNFLHNNKTLTTLNAPNLQRVGYGVLFYNEVLTILNAPNIRVYGDDFLEKHPTRAKIVSQFKKAYAERDNIASRIKRGIQNIYARVQMMGNSHPNYDI